MTLEYRVAKLESDVFGLQLRSSERVPSYEPIKRASNSLNFWCTALFAAIWFVIGVNVGITLTLRNHTVMEHQTAHQEKSDDAPGPDLPGHETH